MRIPDSPTPYLQYHCITIKITMKDEPIRLESPLEGFSCIGRIARIYGLPMPEFRDTFFQMREELQKEVESRPSPGTEAQKVLKILSELNRDSETGDLEKDIVEYAYEKTKTSPN